jgi:sucrose-6-phosphate hydrolase SacC (GH32 family)
MNDPNGLIYYKGKYHLFFQHNPFENVWGHMSWGHAVSEDLISWTELPVAIGDDEAHAIFSGSAVIDYFNTTGFGTLENPAMVAIYTAHKHDDSHQSQALAYSLDEGLTWVKYQGNPVLDLQLDHFRDPKVMWDTTTESWLMSVVLPKEKKVSFYTSVNLKEWRHLSDFGPAAATDGDWECPDLFTLNNENKNYWVLTSSINPGGPNKGSATQYFIGDFDGHIFKSNSNKIKWMDYGADNYAGVTWSNTGVEKISLGWMSNWLYAQQVPTINWRSAMTLPRHLSIQIVGGETYLTSDATKYLEGLPKITKLLTNGFGTLTDNTGTSKGKVYKISYSENSLSPYTVSLSNDLGEHLDFGYDSITNQFFIDRSTAGIKDFNNDFANKHFAPRLAVSKSTSFYAIIDKTSIEFFADNGLTVMTDIFFPTVAYTHISINSNKKEVIKNSLKITSFRQHN